MITELSSPLECAEVASTLRGGNDAPEDEVPRADAPEPNPDKVPKPNPDQVPEPTEKDHVPADPEEQEDAERKDERVRVREEREEAEENWSEDD